MVLSFQLIFPPHAWREEIPAIVRGGGLGVAPLVRNFYHDTRELVITHLRPVTAAVHGRQFGPLDDLVLLRCQPRVGEGDAERLLSAFAPVPTQLVAGLVLGYGAAAGQWVGGVWEDGIVQQVTGFTLVGPGMLRVARTPGLPESPEALERWSRTRGALGEEVWRKVRASRVAVVGAGRNGSVAALSLAMLGVSKLVLIDGDLEERHNLDATVGATPLGLRRPKVENRRRTLAAIRPDDLGIITVPRSLRHVEAVEALRGVDLIATCVDRDPARLAAARAANRWAKVHLDIGTGVFREGAGRRLGGDVRLLLPGEACVACLGGLRHEDQARAELEASARALRRGPRPEWQTGRAGSLVTLNQVVVNLGIQTWLELLAGVLRASSWLRLEWSGGAQPSLAAEREVAAECQLCRRHQAAGGLSPA
jgi:molybdopterin/thiamine biosynthesis adenylyltransferase